MTLPTVHNVEVRAVAVEVKVLALAGKQMTLSVFRQIRNRDLINNDGILNGQPWGVIEYHPDKCEKDPEHLHVLWRSGEDLYRSRVEANPKFEPRFEPPQSWIVMDAVVRDAVLTGGSLPKRGLPYYTRRVCGLEVKLTMSDAADRVVDAATDLRDSQRNLADLGPSARVAYFVLSERVRPRELRVSLPAVVRANWQEVDDALEKLDAETAGTANEILEAAVRAEKERRRRHLDARRDLADLPQYFIAI